MIYVATLSNPNREYIKKREVVSDINELYVAIASKDCTQLILRDDFVRLNFTPSGVILFINEVKDKFPKIIIETELDYENEVKSNMKMIPLFSDPEDLINYVVGHREEALQLVQNLIKEHNSSISESVVANNKISTMQLQLSELIHEKEIEVSRREHATNMLSITQSKLDTLVSRINYSYNKDINPDKMLGMDLKHSNFKKILYVKEITRVHFTDTFLYYLQEELKALYHVPVRFVVIEARDAYDISYQYERCKDHLNLTFKDIVYNDIFMAGYQQHIMEDVLENTANYNYLIILDRSKGFKPYVRGKNVETYYTVSDLKDFRNYSELDKIISYNKDTLHITHIEGFDAMSSDEKIRSYSSLNIMKKTINLLELERDQDGEPEAR